MFWIILIIVYPMFIMVAFMVDGKDGVCDLTNHIFSLDVLDEFKG